MNISFRFLIFTIFLSLGFITSCNDDITPTEEEKPSVNDTKNIASTETSSTDDSTKTTEPPPLYSSDEIDKIDPEDLSRQIKEIGEKIEELEKESSKHFEEYDKLAEFQKKILEDIKVKKMIMRSKIVGSEEEKKAKKDFEDEKKYGREKLQILKEKNIVLYKITRSIREAKNKKEELEKKREDFLMKQKNKENKKIKKIN
ncbi:hypothetical protein [Blattabacterium cuenoti]|uniref:hypothetical protein n=1 Tax=Blattabacterium cuenoti TaxID=1653831 RepID=UPI00311F3C78